jgi:hypothetical protein
MTNDDDRGPEVALRLIATLCGAGSCPTIYRTDRGTLVVQGTPISAEAAGIDLPEGEMLIEIPEDLLGEVGTRP